MYAGTASELHRYDHPKESQIDVTLWHYMLVRIYVYSLESMQRAYMHRYLASNEDMVVERILLIIT